MDAVAALCRDQRNWLELATEEEFQSKCVVPLSHYVNDHLQAQLKQESMKQITEVRRASDSSAMEVMIPFEVNGLLQDLAVTFDPAAVNDVADLAIAFCVENMAKLQLTSPQQIQHSCVSHVSNYLTGLLQQRQRVASVVEVDDSMTQTSPIARTVVIFSSRPCHYEITAFAACTLKKLGYVVHLWLVRNEASERIMSSCADEIFDVQTASQSWKFPSDLLIQMSNHYVDSKRYDIHLLVYVSASQDLAYARAHGVHQLLQPVVAHTAIVAHDAKDAVEFGQHCQRPRCTILCLADHVTQQTKDYLEISMPSADNAISLFDVQTMVPSFDLQPALPQPTRVLRYGQRIVTTIVIQGKMAMLIGDSIDIYLINYVI